MSKENHFFMRDPWVYDPEARQPKRDDSEQGFDTRALHAGFHPLEDLEAYRSFVVKNGMAGAAAVMNAFKLVVHAVTFGTSKTICMHPATITHEHMTPAERAEAGIDDGLIRFSVGLENPEDIIADLEQALSNS